MSMVPTAVMAPDPLPTPPSAGGSDSKTVKSLKRDPDDDVQFVSEKLVKKARTESNQKSHDQQHAYLPSPTSPMAKKPPAGLQQEKPGEQVRQLPSLNSLLCGVPALRPEKRDPDAQHQQLPSPTSLLTSTPVFTTIQAVLNDTKSSSAEHSARSSLAPSTVLQCHPPGDGTGYLEGLPPSMGQFAVGGQLHHSMQARCFSPPVSPKTVDMASTQPDHQVHEANDPQPPAVLSNNTAIVHKQGTREQIQEATVRADALDPFPTLNQPIRPSFDFQVPMLFPMSPSLNSLNCLPHATDYQTWPDAITPDNTGVAMKTQSAPGVQGNTSTNDDLSQADDGRRETEKPAVSGKSEASKNLDSGLSAASNPQLAPAVTAMPSLQHAMPGLGTHPAHCELCARGQPPTPFHPVYGGMAPQYALMQGGQAPFGAQQRPGGGMGPGMMPSGPLGMGMMPPPLPYTAPWSMGQANTPMQSGFSGYSPFLGVSPQSTLLNATGPPAPFTATAHSRGPSPSLATPTTTAMPAVASKTDSTPSDTQKPTTSAATITSNTTPSTASKPASTTSAATTPASQSKSSTTGTGTGTGTGTTSSSSSSNNKKTKHAQNLYVDIAETCESLLPCVDIARRHGVSRQRVADVFAAVVQVPLLRCPNDKRRVGKLGVARMKEYNRGRRDLVAATGAAAAAAASQKNGGGGGSKAQQGKSGASSSTKPAQPTLYEVAQFMGPVDVPDGVAGGEQAGKGRW